MPCTAKEIVIDGITLTLTHKRVKNLNLRVRADGSVALSVPLRCSTAQAQAFVRARAQWIASAQTRAAQRGAPTPCTVLPQDALALFTTVSERVFPLFAEALCGERPTLKVRLMKTRWGVCSPAKKQITLNLALAQKPMAAVEYVVVHEYAHFVRADHSPAFWAVVERVLPDWKARRALLKDP